MSETRRLQYNYAGIDLATGECMSCMTYSYEITDPRFIPVPSASNDYIGKYYNQANGSWYEDADFSIPWTPPV